MLDVEQLVLERPWLERLGQERWPKKRTPMRYDTNGLPRHGLYTIDQLKHESRLPPEPERSGLLRWGWRGEWFYVHDMHMYQENKTARWQRSQNAQFTASAAVPAAAQHRGRVLII